uniref:Uncharacterized protein n=1 Tax=Oncorhynchus kisutch TaxID=8019 RepID=A0A8C7DW57_ONCKI
MGLQAIIQTIMMGKMDMVLPDMYIMNRFIGICFRGPRATSQQRCHGEGGGERKQVNNNLQVTAKIKEAPR